MERQVSKEDLDKVQIPYWVTDGLSPEDAKKAEAKYKKGARFGYRKCKAFMIEYGQEPPEEMVNIMSDSGEKYQLKNIDSHLVPEKGYSMILWYNEYTDISDTPRSAGENAGT